jgi:argininosuccinate lyase
VKTAIAAGASAIDRDQVQRIAREITGADLDITGTWLAQQLDPRAFVAARTVPGGPAPQAINAAASRAQAAIARDSATVEAARTRVKNAGERRKTLIDALVDTRT